MSLTREMQSTLFNIDAQCCSQGLWMRGFPHAASRQHGDGGKQGRIPASWDSPTSARNAGRTGSNGTDSFGVYTDEKME